MDKATIIGILSALGVVILAIGLGNYPLGFISIPGALIVVGGTLSITIAMITFRQFVYSFGVVRKAFVDRPHSLVGLVDEIEELSQVARHDGALALEDQEVSHPFMQKGVRMIVDGQPMEVIEQTLERDIELSEERHDGGVQMFKSIYDVAPAMGMIGTLVGLVQMLSSLDDPSTIGPAMATALLTTFYGAVIAQAIALPIMTKLAMRSTQESREQRLILEGIRGIQDGINPRILRGLLETFLPSRERQEET
ncbi:MotA/TolQ/ExbB proton channel family protein [Guyparkeria sp. 1SP6A2]|nr:MotA/TolQ/ExbB proton channel family protein [Guyparkeria sp. 1SP6A2]